MQKDKKTVFAIAISLLVLSTLATTPAAFAATNPITDIYNYLTGTIKTELDAIKAKTDTISWGDITAIKTKTDNLGTAPSGSTGTMWGDINRFYKMFDPELDPTVNPGIYRNTEQIRTFGSAAYNFPNGAVDDLFNEYLNGVTGKWTITLYVEDLDGTESLRLTYWVGGSGAYSSYQYGIYVTNGFHQYEVTGSRIALTGVKDPNADDGMTVYYNWAVEYPGGIMVPP